MKALLNPSSLPRSPAFSQGVAVTGGSTTIYVGGQNGITASGAVASTTLDGQVEQALANVEAVLAEAGATVDDVVRWTIAVVQGQSLPQGFTGFVRRYGSLAEPPAISVTLVAGLANPAFLVEIDAIAVLHAR